MIKTCLPEIHKPEPFNGSTPHQHAVNMWLNLDGTSLSARTPRGTLEASESESTCFVIPAYSTKLSDISFFGEIYGSSFSFSRILMNISWVTIKKLCQLGTKTSK